MTLAEAALLAGIVKGPSIYSPRVNKERAEKRRAFVLGQMREKRFVPAAQIDAALAEPIRLAPEPEHSDELAPEVLAEAERALRKAVGPEARYGGYTVVTSIDPGKTGTTNDAKDAWFVGYSTDIACAVWTGFDDATPLGGREVGSSAALPAFIAFMDKAHAGRPATDFPEPLGIVRLPVDPETGALAMPGQESAVEEVFLEGTEPTGVALPDPSAIGQGILDLFKPQ